MEKIRLQYSKGAEVKYIGHLDIVRVWERALRRTDLPCAYSEGFNPRQKMSFGPPLSLGMTSECELLDVQFERWVSANTVKEELNKVLPQGITVIDAKNVFSGSPAITAFIRFAEYRAESDEDLSAKVRDILAKEKIVVTRKDKDVDIRPMIKDLRLEEKTLIITVKCDNFGSVKGDEIRGLFPGTTLHGLKRTLLA